MGQGTAVAASLFSAGTSIMGARSSYKAGMIEAAGYERQARFRDLQAKQISADAREELNARLESINVAAAARNIAMSSPSQRALRSAIVNEARRAESREVLGALAGADTDRLSAIATRRNAKSSLLGGYASAAGSVAQAASYYPAG